MSYVGYVQGHGFLYEVAHNCGTAWEALQFATDAAAFCGVGGRKVCAAARRDDVPPPDLAEYDELAEMLRPPAKMREHVRERAKVAVVRLSHLEHQWRKRQGLIEFAPRADDAQD